MTTTTTLTDDELSILSSTDVPGGPTAAGRWERGESGMTLSLRHTKMMTGKGWRLVEVLDAAQAKAAAGAFIASHPNWKDDPKTKPRRDR